MNYDSPGVCYLLALPFFLFTSREVLVGRVEEKRENETKSETVYREDPSILHSKGFQSLANYTSFHYNKM